MQQIKKILIYKDGQVFYVKDTSKEFHTQYGMIAAKELEKTDGSRVLTNTGVEMTLLSPQFVDSFAKISRGAQIITRKDVGAIIAETGLNKEWIVVDCGAGSGGMACSLAYAAKKVVSYDLRKDHLETVEKNMKFLGLDNYELKNADVYEKIDEKDVDLITVDVPEPWKVLENATKSLKPGGFLVSYSPSVTQSMNAVLKCEEFGLLHIKTIELIERAWDIRERVCHPKYKELNHTGFLSFFRKIR